MKVMKFGGSCLQSRAGLERMIELVRPEPRPLVVVLSALKGVTDGLIDLVEAAGRGEPPDVTEIRRRHGEVLETLAEPLLEETGRRLEAHLEELERILGAVAALGEVPEPTRDRILGMGERMSVLLAAGHLAQQGIPARSLVADEAGVLTTDEPGDARILARSEQLCRERLPAGEDLVYVVAGYVGKSVAGRWTTLGRGGSDTTATFLAAALGGPAVLWKDTAGLLTGDPRVVAEPRVIDSLHYLDALEMAHYGLPAIAQKAVHPARRAGVPIEVRSFLDGDAPSVIGDVPTTRLAISCVSEVVMVDLVRNDEDLFRSGAPDGAGAARDDGVAEPGPARGLYALARFLEALAGEGVVPLLLTEASPAGETSVVVKAAHIEPLKRAVEQVSHSLDVGIRDDLAAVSLIGSSMRGKIGFAASVFACLAGEGVNIDAIAQTASERNISVIVAREQALPAVRALHRHFVEGSEAGSHGAVGAAV